MGVGLFILLTLSHALPFPTESKPLSPSLCIPHLCLIMVFGMSMSGGLIYWQLISGHMINSTLGGGEGWGLMSPSPAVMRDEMVGSPP